MNGKNGKNEPAEKNEEAEATRTGNSIARDAVKLTVFLAIAGWMFSVERNTAATATSTGFILDRWRILESEVSKNRESGGKSLVIGNKNATRLDGVDRRLDYHQRIFEAINIFQKGIKK